MEQQRFARSLLISAALIAALQACGAEAPVAAGGPEAEAPDPAPSASGSVAAPPPPPDASVVATPETVRIEEDRELRGLWVASVYGLDFPGTPKPPEAAVARLQAIVDVAAKAGINALFFQVRPESDALYQSTLEPWSRFLTGTQGQDPGYDPLGTLLAMAHARGIEVHAWVNPYRAIANKNDSVTAGHVASVLESSAITYGEAVVMDPGSSAVRGWVLAVVDDLLDHYDVDGLHYDDYFYPYPTAANTPFPDNPTFEAYLAGGGDLTRKAWRIENVNALVRSTAELIQNEHPSVRFGISPFGIHRPDPALGIVGLDAYDVLACDAPRWLAEGWTDYVAPQLYWPTTMAARPFGTLANFWSRQIRGESEIYLGHALYHLGTSIEWSFDELASQVAIGRGLRASGLTGVAGSIFFKTESLEAAGVADAFAARLFPNPALPPTLPRAARVGGEVPVPVVAERSASSVRLTLEAAPPQFRALYTQSEGGERWQLLRVVPGSLTELGLPQPGIYAVSSVATGAVESRAVVVRAGVP